MGVPVASWRGWVAVGLLWSGVPLWVLVAVDGPGPFAFGFFLAVLVSVPAVLVTAVVAGRGVIRLVRRRGVRTSSAVRVAVAAHLLAVASFPVSAAVGSAFEQRRATALLAGLEADAEACAVSTMAACSVVPSEPSAGRSQIAVSLVAALRREHSRQQRLTRAGDGLPPAPLDFAGAREDGPAARFG